MEYVCVLYTLHYYQTALPKKETCHSFQLPIILHATVKWFILQEFTQASQRSAWRVVVAVVAWPWQWVNIKATFIICLLHRIWKGRKKHIENLEGDIIVIRIQGTSENDMMMMSLIWVMYVNCKPSSPCLVVSSYYRHAYIYAL